MQRIEVMSCYKHINSHYKICYWSIFCCIYKGFMMLRHFSLHSTCTQTRCVLPSNLYCVLNWVNNIRKQTLLASLTWFCWEDGFTLNGCISETIFHYSDLQGGRSCRHGKAFYLKPQEHCYKVKISAQKVLIYSGGGMSLGSQPFPEKVFKLAGVRQILWLKPYS